MGVTFVNSNSVTSSDASGICAVTKPTDTQEGDLILSFTHGPEPTGWDTLSGFTLMAFQNSGTGASAVNYAVFWKYATASEPSTYNWQLASHASGHGLVAVVTLRGVDPQYPFTGWVSAQSTTANGLASGTVTTFDPNSFMLATNANRQATGTVTCTSSDGSDIERVDVNSNAADGTRTIAIYTQDSVGAGSQSRTLTVTGTTTHHSIFLISIAPDIPGTIRQRSAASTASAATAGATLTINKPRGASDGDCLFAVLTSNNTTIGPPAGWTTLAQVLNPGPSVYQTEIYYKTASGEGASWAFDTSGPSGVAPVLGTVVAFTGVDSVSPPVASQGTSNAAEPYVTPTVTNTYFNGLLLYLRSTRIVSSTPITFTASGIEIADHGIFSGGTISYSHGLYRDTNMFLASGGNKSGLGITASATESDTAEFTIVLPLRSYSAKQPTVYSSNQAIVRASRW